jgi:uncharacterized protein (DUF2062 family)
MSKLSKDGFERSATRRATSAAGLIYRRFLKLRGEPHAIAMGLAFGVFVGMSPLMGLHSVIAVAMAALFKWSKIAALIGVFVTNPLTAPLIYPLTYTLGAAVLGNPVSLGAGGIDPGGLFHSSPRLLSNLFVGGGLVGLAGGAVSYLVAMRTIRQYRRRRQLRAEGEVPFAAVRRRLMRVARRQRRKTRQKPSKTHPDRQKRRSRRPRDGGIAAGGYALRPLRPRQPMLLPVRRHTTRWASSAHLRRIP